MNDPETWIIYAVFGAPALVGLGEALLRRRGILATITSISSAIVGGVTMMFLVANILGPASSELSAGLQIFASLAAGAILMLMFVNRVR